LKNWRVFYEGPQRYLTAGIHDLQGDTEIMLNFVYPGEKKIKFGSNHNVALIKVIH